MEERVSLYRPILKKAWQTIFKTKSLWFFGFFAALLGVGGEFEILSRLVANRTVVDQSIIGGMMDSINTGISLGLATGGNLWGNIWYHITTSPFTVASIILVFVIIGLISLFFLWLAVVSEVGLIRNGSLAAKNKKASLNEGIEAGVKNFWSVASANILLNLALFIIFSLLGLVLMFASQNGTWGIVYYYVLFIFAVLLVLSISFLARYQICYIVLKKYNFVESFKLAWKMINGNWLISLEMALLMFLVYVIGMILNVVVVVFSICLPFIFLIYYPLGWAIAFAWIVALVLMFAWFFWSTAVIISFQWTCWMMLFEQLDIKGGVSKIARVAGDVAYYFPGNKEN